MMVIVISIISSIKKAKDAMSQTKNIFVSMSNEDISKTIFKKLSTGQVGQNGQTVEIKEEPKHYCEYCGVAIKKDASKCKNCGAPVKK